ncbi:hypothetical protein [Streptomyces sp. SID14515]|uniref:hypothetical protein n=1 Tax=Streptomyces sp. SID14515 TaxID=2706074 RepID=UPI0013C617A9|nr:hypothetical protein [Streptomyces sp. SID14515]NEB42270.1 hypothetical protein [Streptomyces sp. SID14515]
MSDTRYAVTITVTAVNLAEADLDTLRQEIEDAAVAYKGDVTVDGRDYIAD